MARKKKKTSDALSIIDRRHFDTPEARAELVGTTHTAISRLENDDYEGHSLAMLRGIAAALGKRVEVRFVPSRRNRSA